MLRVQRTDLYAQDVATPIHMYILTILYTPNSCSPLHASGGLTVLVQQVEVTGYRTPHSRVWAGLDHCPGVLFTLVLLTMSICTNSGKVELITVL